MRNVCKRLLAVALTIVTLAALLCGTGLTASAASTVSHRNAKRGDNGAIYMLEHRMNVLTYNGRYTYCINRTASWGSLDRTEVANGTNLENSRYWNSLGDTKQRLLGKLMPHCFPAMSASELGVSSVDDAFVGSQIIIWEITDGLRDANGNRTNGWMYEKIKGTPAQTAYDNIDKALRSHSTHTSWDNATVKLEWNDANQRYEATLTDNNGVLEQFKNSYRNVPSDLHIERNGNTLTLWSTAPVSTGTTAIRFDKNLKTAADTGELIILENPSAPNEQQMLVAGCLAGDLADPVSSQLYITTNSGWMGLIKTTTIPGGQVGHIEFGIQCPYWNGGEEKVVQTDFTGKLKIELPAGQTYTIREITTFEGVQTPPAQKVTIKENETVEVRFVNKPESVDLTIRKVDLSLYNNVANIPFRVAHTGNELAAFNWYYRDITDENGETTISGDVVTGYYKDKLAENNNNAISAARAIYKDVFGKSYVWDGPGGVEATRYGVIYAALGIVQKNSELIVAKDSEFEVTELGWALKDAGVPHPEYYTVYYEPNQEYTEYVQTDNAQIGKVFEFYNYPTTPDVLLIKTSPDSTLDGNRVNGVPFLLEMLDEDKTTVLRTFPVTKTSRTYVNGQWEDGVIWATGALDPGWLRITEDPDWCIANGYEVPDPQIVFVEPNKRVTVTFVNKPRVVPVPVRKTSDDGVVAGFDFNLTGDVTFPTSVHIGMSSAWRLTSNEEGLLVYKRDCTTPDGITHKAGELLLLYPGTYSIREVQTAAQRKRYEQPEPLTFTVEKGSGEQTVRYIHNKISPTPVPLKKTSASGVVEGFHFTLSGKTDWGKDVAAMSLRSNAAGDIRQVTQDGSLTDSDVGLYPGTYTIEEILTAEQQKLWKQPDPITFVVKDKKIYIDGKEVTGVAFENVGRVVPVPIKKTSDTGEVEGFHFSVTSVGTDAMGNTVKYTDLVSSKDGMVLTADGKVLELYDGDYTLSEQLTAEQQQQWERPLSFVFSVKNGQILLDGKVVDAVSFANVRLGSISVHKTNATGQSLAGAEYLLEYSTNNGKTWRAVTRTQCSSAGLVDGVLTTGEDGMAVFEGLTTRYTYRLTEVKAPEGCSLLTAPIYEGKLPVSLADGTITRDPVYPVTNDTVQLPPTGEGGTSLVVFAGMAMLSIAGAAFVYIFKTKKRKEND